MSPQKKPHNSKEIRITRIYDAPIQAVWDAWTDAAQVAKWWGPRGFTLTTHSKDLKVGGHWHYTMHGPDGIDYPNKTRYIEVEPLVKLVYDHGGNDEQAPLFRVTVFFSEENGKTTMDMSMALPTAEAAEERRKFIHKAGGNATWDRLAEYLEKESSGKEQFVINRTFHVPINVMFDMWTKKEHLSQWLPPTGFTMEFIRCDIRTGGKSFYVMAGNGISMYGRVEYLCIDKPNCLIYTQQFCDANESVSRHPLATTWPETMLTTIKFFQETPEYTRVTVTWEPFGNTTAAELDTFIGARTGMTQGWTGSFEKLDAYIGN